MRHIWLRTSALVGFVTCGTLCATDLSAQINTGEAQILSTGQTITPLAPRGASFEPLNPGLADNPGYTVGHAVSTAP